MTDEIIEKMAMAAYCDSYTQYGTCTPERWKQTSETQRQFFRSQMRVVAAVLVAAGLLAACASKELPPLPPAADMCVLYRSYTYAPAAAAVESIDSLRSHVANESAYAQKCLAHNTTTPGGPR